MATKGLNHFNSWKGTNYKFRKIVSVISTAACGVNLYTTFESTDPKASRAIQSFVAVIYCGPLGTDVLSCGLKNPSHGGQSSDDDASRPWVHLKENEGWSIGVHGKLEEYSTGTKSKALESREFMKGGGYTHCSSYMVKDDPGVWKSHYQQIHRSMAGTCWSSSWGRK
ncbi:hypothetical protein ACH5RR_019818 [Cinchona calisaya]|uniref:Uncharacterized protein n=1 Tax=Cinchona calisaya TaxID=153742 RepID=A0ABD2ZQG3_9GENT